MRLYEQINRDLKNDILDNKIKLGEKLPSIVTISKKYKCSKGTVIKAMDELCSQHIIYSKPQSGYYVADNFIRQLDDREGYYLDTGNPVIDSFPTPDIKHCLHIAADLYAKYSLDLSFRGMCSLTPILSHHLAIDGIYTRSENIHLIQGITQMLTHLTLHPFPNHKNTILIEEPTYYHYVNFLKSIDVRVLTIRRNEKGIDLKKLEEYFKYEDVKFFYTVPRNHNPLGTSYTYGQRKRIMELALYYNVYIIEDDYFGSVHNIPKYVPIHFFSYQKNCIYLRSSTKEFPLIRIGMVVIPDSFKETFKGLSESAYHYSYLPSLISQATWETYVKTSLYEKHTVKITKLINKKLSIVEKVTASWNPEYVTLLGGRSGYYFMLRLHQLVDADEAIRKLQDIKVYVLSNREAYYHDENYDNSIRISISRIPIEHLNNALSMIYHVIEEMYRKSKKILCSNK